MSRYIVWSFRLYIEIFSQTLFSLKSVFSFALYEDLRIGKLYCEILRYSFYVCRNVGSYEKEGGNDGHRRFPPERVCRWCLFSRDERSARPGERKMREQFACSYLCLFSVPMIDWSHLGDVPLSFLIAKNGALPPFVVVPRR